MNTKTQTKTADASQNREPRKRRSSTERLIRAVFEGDGSAYGKPQCKPEVPQWYGAFDSEGKLRATFDSSSEAYCYCLLRGHMEGGTDRPIVNHADKLAEALRQIAENKLSNDNCASVELAGKRCANIARQALAEWEKTKQ